MGGGTGGREGDARNLASREPRRKLIIPPTVDVKNDEGALVTIRKISALYRTGVACAEDGLENQDKTPVPRGKKRKSEAK